MRSRDARKLWRLTGGGAGVIPFNSKTLAHRIAVIRLTWHEKTIWRHYLELIESQYSWRRSSIGDNRWYSAEPRLDARGNRSLTGRNSSGGDVWSRAVEA